MKNRRKEKKALQYNNDVAYSMLVINAEHVTAANTNCLVAFFSYICNLIIARILIKI